MVVRFAANLLLSNGLRQSHGTKAHQNQEDMTVVVVEAMIAIAEVIDEVIGAHVHVHAHVHAHAARVVADHVLVDRVVIETKVAAMTDTIDMQAQAALVLDHVAVIEESLMNQNRNEMIDLAQDLVHVKAPDHRVLRDQSHAIVYAS